MKTVETPTVPILPSYKRDEYGLIENAKYVYNDDGSVNWREMIKPEFLYVNKEWFEIRGKEIPSSIEGLKDRQLLILLGGIKELAKLRGFESVKYKLTWLDKTNVAAKCRIVWKGNYETDGSVVEFEDYANATIDNTDVFCHKFLETIACNRSFIRCVRNFLNIHIVGADEIDKSNNKSINVDSSEDKEDLNVLKPYGLLEKIAQEKKIMSFEDFIVALRAMWTNGSYKNAEASNWKSYKDIPAKECRKLISLLGKLNESQESS